MGAPSIETIFSRVAVGATGAVVYEPVLLTAVVSVRLSPDPSQPPASLAVAVLRKIAQDGQSETARAGASARWAISYMW